MNEDGLEQSSDRWGLARPPAPADVIKARDKYGREGFLNHWISWALGGNNPCPVDIGDAHLRYLSIKAWRLATGISVTVPILTISISPDAMSS